jgi:hypothetical protein
MIADAYDRATIQSTQLILQRNLKESEYESINSVNSLASDSKQCYVP